MVFYTYIVLIQEIHHGTAQIVEVFAVRLWVPTVDVSDILPKRLSFVVYRFTP